MLSLRELSIIEKRFGFINGKIWTLAEIACEYGLTRSRIGQIETKALKKLRKMFEYYLEYKFIEG